MFLLGFDQGILHRAVLLDGDALLQEQLIEASNASFAFRDLGLERVALGLDRRRVITCLLTEFGVERRGQDLADARVPQGLASLGHEAIFPNVRLRARAALLGAAVVVVALLDFHGDAAAALAAPKGVAPRELVKDGLLAAAAIEFHLPASVEELLRDQRLVLSFVVLALVPQNAVVERIGEGVVDPGDREPAVTDASDSLGDHPVAEFFHRVRALGVELEHLPQQRAPHGIDGQRACVAVVDVTERGRGRPVAILDSIGFAATDVLREAVHVVLRVTEHHAQGVLAVGVGLEGTRAEFEILDEPGVHHVDDGAAVNGVACETVGVPSHDAVGFAAFQAFDHLAEHRAAGVLGTLLLNEYVRDNEALPVGKSPHLGDLIFDRALLPHAIVGGFAGIEKILEACTHRSALHGKP